MDKDNNVIEILKKGFQSSIQGNYRYNYFGQGIPPSGPMDEYSHHMGNILVGNNPEAPSIELTLIGDKIRFLKETIFAVTGVFENAKLNNKIISAWRTYRVIEGDVLELGFAKNGCRGYLSIVGGFNVPTVLESTSTYVRGSIGGYRGRFLAKGDILQDNQFLIDSLIQLENLMVTKEAIYYPGKENILYITLGPQMDLVKEESILEFFNSEWIVSMKMDRVGIRFTGPQLFFKNRIKDPSEGKDLSNIIDDGIPIGGMQIPSGKEIICMARDGVSAGGFVKIGTVVTVSLDTLGQLVPGKKIRFEEISPKEAREKLVRKRARRSVNYIRKI